MNRPNANTKPWPPACVLAVAAFSLSTLLAQAKLPAAKQIASLVESELEAARVPGAAVAIVAGDETLARGYGVASVESGEPMDAQTLVHIGSLTKVLTALAIASTLDQQAVAPTTPVGKYLNGLSARASKASFHELLSHSSGLRDRPGGSGNDDERALGQAARELTEADFLLPAGTVFSYSNLGYALAGAALEQLRKQRFAESLRDAVLTPLGMARTTIRPAEARERPHAVGHRVESGHPIVVAPANDTRLWPAGYVWSSAADMARLLSALINGGRVYGKTSVPVSAITAVASPHVPMPNVFVGGHYGYGLMIARDRSVLIYEHGGTHPGYSSILRIAPGRRLGVAILANVDGAPLRRIAQNVMASVLGLGEPPSATRDEQPVSAVELQPFVGVYRNRGTAEIAVSNDRVTLSLDGGSPMSVARLGPERFVARPAPNVGGPEFVLRAGGRDAPAYLHFGLWAYVRD